METKLVQTEELESEYEIVEAHIDLRVRNGVPNTLATFQASVTGTTENEDGTLNHNMPTSDIIQGLAYALHDAISSTRAQVGGGSYDKWFANVRDWIFRGVEA